MRQAQGPNQCAGDKVCGTARVTSGESTSGLKNASIMRQTMADRAPKEVAHGCRHILKHFEGVLRRVGCDPRQM